MAHLALIHGANGLLLYSYFDLFHPPGKPEDMAYFDARWAEVGALGRELAGMLPLLLGGSDVRLRSHGTAGMQSRILEHRRRLHWLVANPSRTGEATRVFTLPAEFVGKPVILRSGAVQARHQPAGLAITVPPVGSGVVALAR